MCANREKNAIKRAERYRYHEKTICVRNALATIGLISHIYRNEVFFRHSIVKLWGFFV